MAFQLPETEDGLTPNDLRRLTISLIDDVQKMLRRCKDADVTFVPVDPAAHDAAAATDEEANIAWTLGHIIVHMTASSEESAALASELARGVEYHGRSRNEVQWQSVTTMAQCRSRLEESRRMRLASLGLWPNEPHLENTYEPWAGARAIGPVGRFLIGLRHDASHLDQIREVIDQARRYRFQHSPLGRLLRRGKNDVVVAPVATASESEAATPGAAPYDTPPSDTSDASETTAS